MSLFHKDLQKLEDLVISNCFISSKNMSMKKYGFFIMCQTTPNEKFKIYLHSEQLFNDMIKCVEAARICPLDVPDHPDFKTKIAYYQILTNKELIQHLHTFNPECVSEDE